MEFYMYRSTVNSILELIGNTRIVRLNKIVKKGSATVWGKLENLNPAGSIKERICLGMIEAAENENTISPGKNVIVEPTSGNTGIGLALVCAVKGYELVLTMPDNMSIERRQVLEAYGAKIILTPSGEKIEGAVKKAEEIVKNNPNAFMPQQFKNSNNPKSHSLTTAQEILEQVPGEIHAFVAGVGTGGTISGVGDVLRKKFPYVKIIAVEPEESAVLSGKKPDTHEIQGIGTGFVPEILDRNIYDEVVTVKGQEAKEFTRLIARKEGLLVGISSGASCLVAVREAKRLGKGKHVVTMLYDSGERYLSTGMFSDD